MQKLPITPPCCPAPRQFLMRLPIALFVVAVLAWIPGCPDSISKNIVSGKVTSDGKQVAGEVTFIGADNKQKNAPIGPDGVYTIVDPPMGTVKITVKAMAGLGGVAPPTGDTTGGKKDKIMKDMPADKSVMGVPPPKKYESPDNGLTFEVKGGKQEKDLVLTP